MSEVFWLVFWGVMSIIAGAVVAVLVHGTWWIGALIGLGIYLLILLLGSTGGNGTFIYIDLD